jgi:phosphatidylserine decarboxylase
MRNGIILPWSQRNKKVLVLFVIVRTRPAQDMDMKKGHLISPCDGWLSAYAIQNDSSFLIKNSFYCLRDLLQDEELSKSYIGGVCLIFRLCASDYHHYCYIDDGYQGKNNYIPGMLHSVQPIACETYPVYTLNRRSWTLMVTEHFGPVVQTEVGALIVGGIVNERENSRFQKGMEKGHFELSGSTIVLLFQKDRICLLPHIVEHLVDNSEIRVKQGMWIGNQNFIERGK